MISESDWKKFKVIKANALERFCGIALTDFKEAISGKEPTNHGKYLYLYKLVQNYDKRIALLFDSHSRSKAIIQLSLLREENLVTDEELQPLSEQLKEFSKPRKNT